MKNKGFTLIELLSVIVVIAIVTLIAFPVISGVVEKTKLKALEDSAYGLVEASNLYYAQYQNSETKRFDKNEDENTLKNLSYKGSIEKGTVIINNKGQVTVCISDGKNSAYKNYNENKVTSVAKKTCTVPSNTYIVYLDDERTVKTYTTEELTEIVEELKSEVATLKEENNNVINKIYPIGSIYTSTCGGTTETECLKTPSEVATKFGGTWEVYGEGRVLQSSTGTSGSTGGSNSVTLSASNIPSLSSVITGSITIPPLSVSTWSGSHSHLIPNWVWGYTSDGSQYVFAGGTGPGKLNTEVTASTITVSGQTTTAKTITSGFSLTGTYTNNSQAKVNVQNKYITVYMYKRTA